ncbi:MAG: aminotransferase class IV [Actinomycetota bacterium]
MSTVLIDGRPGPGLITAFDGAVLRGDGCFEAIRSYGGTPFAFGEHFDRLVGSAGGLGLPVPARQLLKEWVEIVANEGGDCVVRVVLTRGSAVPGPDLPGRCIVLWHSVPVGPGGLSLAPVAAPWHPAGEAWELAGVKTTSYAANQAASRKARVQGSDDALLYSRDRVMLEGPTFSIAWVVDGVLETPGLELGILESITRRFMLYDASRIGIQTRTGSFRLERLTEADEVLAMSTIKEIAGVYRVGDRSYHPGPITQMLVDAYRLRTQLSDPQLTTGR